MLKDSFSELKDRIQNKGNSRKIFSLSGSINENYLVLDVSMIKYII
jgi:hypothetical protein